jgi:hypothetical protein
MPASPVPLWIFTLVMLVGFPALNLIYWPLVLQSGALSPDADSIAIPMVSSLAVTVGLTPIVLGTTWLCLRRYNPDARLVAMRRDRPLRTFLATALFGGMAFLVVGAEAFDWVTHGWNAEVPWYEYLWSIYLFLGVYWLLAMRAAFIEQFGPAT